MPAFLKQSTAVDIALGPFLDSTDGVTPETALTISQADVRLKKNSAAWAQKNDANAAVHEENGWYEVALNATDTNTLGQLVVAVNEGGALPVWRMFMVVPANVYDSLVGGTDNLDIEVPTVTAQAIADALLGRRISGGASTGRLVKEALATLRNRIVISGGTLTVYDVDDTTVVYTATVTAAAVNPITGIDPA